MSHETNNDFNNEFDKSQDNERDNALTTKEHAYSPKEVADQLDLATSTVRKYSIALEKTGYVIIRNALENRVYIRKDVEILRAMYNLTRTGTSIAYAAEMVSKNIGKIMDKVPDEEPTTEVAIQAEKPSQDLALLTSIIEQLVDYDREVKDVMTKLTNKNEELASEVAELKADSKRIIELLEDREASKNGETFIKRLINKIK